MAPSSHAGRSQPPPLSRGGERPAPAFVQTRPSAHAEYQYEGMLRGVGSTCKEPTCAKRTSMTKRIHDATHFAIGCEKWDEATRGVSTTHNDFPDYKVVYATCEAPDKNASVVELRMQQFQPEVHFRTEQRDRFEDRGPQPLDQPFRQLISVHLGDDPRDHTTQTASVHGRLDTEARRAAAWRSAGQGALVSNSALPRPERCHPLHGGQRSMEPYDRGVANDNRHNRATANFSRICLEANTRDPILGHHIPHDAMAAPGMRTTAEQIAEANATVPRLRSLSALRPG